MEQNVPVVIVISHGFFFGDVDRVESLPLEEGMDPEVYENALNKLIDDNEGNVFVCADIMGGTPFKSLAKAARTREIYGVAGVSMPMLIEVLSNRDMYTGKELAANVAEACKEIVVDLSEYLEKMHNLGK